ncbi:hypothetical protein BJX63DRAFT_445046 [Aspergillus granulosus]|uniref:Leucine rich repeat protein n=1 Tax=Aspergillus granulosus TaxID=176169 RepID=A0ABR4H3Q7_9EURO
MGRLTYSARKISGIKTGQTVSKDLKKRIPPGTGAKAAARDPTLEIDLTGKALTDTGFAHFINDLLACILYRGDEHPTGLAKVTEFYLQGNNLTVLSLPKLGEVVANSAGDLRELDISQNDICVASAQERAIWKTFLDCFKNCYVLRKLDLSGNPIGPAGLEIFACVYIKSDVDYLETDAAAIVGATANEEPALTEDVRTLSAKGNESTCVNRAKTPVGKGKAIKQNGNSQTTAVVSKSIPASNLKKFACTRGLRAIPYLVLSNIDLRMSSAIHFSHVLAIQRSAEQLLKFLPPGKASAIPESAQSDKCIIWQPNEGLPAFAKRLLEVTEFIREIKSKVESEMEVCGDDEGTQRRMQSRMMLEYTRLKKRVRLESLKLGCASCSNIVTTAVKMMVLSRTLLLEDKDRPVEEESEKDTEVEEKPIIYPDSNVYPPNTSSSFESPFPVGPFDRASAMFEENFPALMKSTPRQLHPIKEETEQELKDSEELAEPSTFARPNPNQPIRSGKGYSRSNKGRKREWRFGLSFDIWRGIIADVVGADGVLDMEQQTRIIYYASDWKAVAYELTIKGVENHQQVWKFLETVGCFTYTPLP